MKLTIPSARTYAQDFVSVAVLGARRAGGGGATHEAHLFP